MKLNMIHSTGDAVMTQVACVSCCKC